MAEEKKKKLTLIHGDKLRECITVHGYTVEALTAYEQWVNEEEEAFRKRWE